ncbi:hypothetical protein VP01_4946g1 [Puccinia sorghi]|uniref:Uncharacterized protein n=1 Tax=Puccinia sorghi TaxID=27349 RepID=A0A0L6ULY9_9BASI|nr:hypothetical protein VP01_4946g1 [Puccinia sorghi]
MFLEKHELWHSTPSAMNCPLVNGFEEAGIFESDVLGLRIWKVRQKYVLLPKPTVNPAPNSLISFNMLNPLLKAHELPSGWDFVIKSKREDRLGGVYIDLINAEGFCFVGIFYGFYFILFFEEINVFFLYYFNFLVFFLYLFIFYFIFYFFLFFFFECLKFFMDGLFSETCSEVVFFDGGMKKMVGTGPHGQAQSFNPKVSLESLFSLISPSPLSLIPLIQLSSPNGPPGYRLIIPPQFLQYTSRFLTHLAQASSWSTKWQIWRGVGRHATQHCHNHQPRPHPSRGFRSLVLRLVESILPAQVPICAHYSTRCGKKKCLSRELLEW